MGYHFLHQDLPHPGIEPWSPALQVDSLHTGIPGGLDDIFTKFSLQVDSSLTSEVLKEIQKPEYKRQRATGVALSVGCPGFSERQQEAEVS